MSLLFSLVVDLWMGKKLEKTKPQVLVCGSPGCSQQAVNSLRANLGMPKIKIAVGCEHYVKCLDLWIKHNTIRKAITDKLECQGADTALPFPYGGGYGIALRRVNLS